MNPDKGRRKFLLAMAGGVFGTILIPKNARAESLVSVDTVVSKLVAIGIPGLIILAIAATSGLAGGAATIMALSTLGGPFGILGGVAAVAILALAVDALAGETFEYIGKKVVEGLKEKGYSNDEILNEIETYPISDDLKDKIKKILPDNQIDQKNV